MYDMTLTIDHNVSVVPVFDLEDIASNRVRSHGLYEVEACFLECNGIFTTILRVEESEKVVDLCTTHLVSGCRIWHYVNNATLCAVRQIPTTVSELSTYPWASCGDSVREEVQI